MKNFLSILLFAALVQTANAQDQAPKKPEVLAQKIAINLEVNLQRLDNNAAYSYQMNHLWKTSATTRQWSMAQDAADHKDHIILLSKIESADDEKLTLRFMVVDAGKKYNIISAPRIIVPYGKKGELTLHEYKQKLRLSVLATMESPIVT